MGETLFEEAHAEPLSTIVLRAIREAIVDGRLGPGEAINEVELAKQFHVSRAPIREAIRQLESEGLVIRIPYRGTAVSPLTSRDIEELQSFRRLIETSAAEQALQTMTTVDIDRLEVIVQCMRDHAKGNDTNGLNQADVDFHTHIIELSGNSLLNEVWTTYVPRIRRVLALRNRVNRDLNSLVQLHQDMLDAFKRRDPVLIQECYRAHGTDLVPALQHLFVDGEVSLNKMAPEVGT